MCAASEEIARGLMALGVRRGDRVAIQGPIGPHWTITLLATTACGATIVALLPTTVPEEMEHVLSDSDAKVIICVGAEQAAKVSALRERLPFQGEVVIAGGDAAGAMSWDSLRERGKERVTLAELDARRDSVRLDDLLALVYTSGTTGPKKGCALSHRNYRVTVDGLATSEIAGERGATFLYMTPHSYGLLMQLLMWTTGCTMVPIRASGIEEVLDELPIVAPTYLPTMPLLLERLHSRALASVPGREAELVAAADAACEVRRHDGFVDEVSARRFETAERELFPAVRALFGDHLRCVITGGAALADDVVRFFNGCGVPLFDSYGMTETATSATMNFPSAHRLGTVGRPIPGVTVRIADDGEVLVHGDNIFRGYWGHDDHAFGEVRDGWLHTGDQGELDADGYLRISGRKKDLVELSHGWIVSPAAVETRLNASPPVSSAVAYGEGKPHLVGLIALDPVWAFEFARRRGLPVDLASLADNDELRAVIQSEVDKANGALQEYFRIHAFDLLPAPLSVEKGELTELLKMRRRVVHERYRDRFEALYQS
jgi:long-chain acyl-CoA synthetase